MLVDERFPYPVLTYCPPILDLKPACAMATVDLVLTMLQNGIFGLLQNVAQPSKGRGPPAASMLATSGLN